MKSILLTLLFLTALPVTASDDLHTVKVEKDIELSVTMLKSNRSLPHAFYDQATTSIHGMHPEHIYLAKRRYGQLGKMQYSILCYKETKKSNNVIITGTAVFKDNAWSFETKVPESSFADKLLIVLEAVANLPSNKSPNNMGRQ